MLARTIARIGVIGTCTLSLLACGGLVPVDLDGDDLFAEAPDRDEEAAEEPPPTPDQLFTYLDPDEEPAEGAPDCPDGTNIIRYPRNGSLHVYCATHSGTKEGPWTRWRGRRLVETRTYRDGRQEGKSATWSTDRDTAGRKLSETWYLGDLKHGDHAEWDAEGTLLVRGTYEDGERKGRFIEAEIGQDGTISFAGACYDDDEETWRTTDELAFVTDPCGDDPGEAAGDSDEVAALR